MEKIILEICAFNIQSAIIAEQAGAHRVELCDNPVEGGTTPSYGAIRRCREHINIELYPIIRPRAGHCWYDDDEYEIMLEDIRQCKALHCDGISVGVQLQSGHIDTNRLQQIVELAYPMGVTCNRAFDAVPDPFKALEVIISCGCERILTSGLQASAPEGADMLAELIKFADERIIIMPGAGIRSGNIEQLRNQTGAREFHTSARKIIQNKIEFSNPAILDIGQIYMADEEEIKRILVR